MDDINFDDMRKMQNDIEGYNVNMVREFKSKLESLCKKYNMINKTSDTLTDRLIPLLIHDCIQASRERFDEDPEEKYEF